MCALVAFVRQRSALARLRDQNGILREAQQEIGRLRSDQAALIALRAALTNHQPPAANELELLRLRNEVSRLRSQRQEHRRLKAENERLAEEMQTAAAHPPDIAGMEGYVASKSWENAGFQTPEATLQTFFWAARDGDFARLAECFSGNQREHFTALDRPGHEQQRETMLNELRQMIPVDGYRMVGKEIQEEGFLTQNGGPPTGEEARISTKVLLRVQAVTGGALWSVSLRLQADGWKLKDL